MCQFGRMTTAIENAGHEVEHARHARERSDESAPDERCMHEANVLDYLFDAIEAMGVRVMGRPSEAEPFAVGLAWLETLRQALAHHPGDVRVIVSILPRGAGRR